MAIRTCPQCMTRVSPGEVVAYSDGMECPGCKAQLEVSPGSRVLATTLGLAAAVLIWRMTEWSGGALSWVLPMVYSFFAFSVVAPIFLMATADLVNKPVEATSALVEGEATSSSHGSVGSHH